MKKNTVALCERCEDGRHRSRMQCWCMLAMMLCVGAILSPRVVYVFTHPLTHNDAGLFWALSFMITLTWVSIHGLVFKNPNSTWSMLVLFGGILVLVPAPYVLAVYLTLFRT